MMCWAAAEPGGSMKHSERFVAIVNTAIRYCKWLIIILTVLICCSGIRVINNYEVGVVLRFGRLVGQTRETQVRQPGLLLAFPYVIDEVIKVPVGKVQEVSITTHAAAADPTYADVASTGYLITGDENILHIDATLKYRISDPVEYALYNNMPQDTINGVVSGVMTSCASSDRVDGLLTDQKEEYARQVIAQSQTLLNELQLGVNIVSLEFQSITPPSALNYHFDQVNAAYVEKETKIQEANQYREKVIPNAKASADQLVSDAQVSRSQGLTTANDRVAEFYGLFEEYQRNQDVVWERVFREKVTKIIDKMGGKIVLPEGEGTPQIFLP